jgi:hypothetical protein
MADSILPVCQVYDQMLNNWQPPDLVIDTSRYHPVVKAARLLSRKLMLPEIVLSVGHNPRNSTAAERKLVLKIKPPADTVPNIVDKLVQKLNFSNAVIFYEPNVFSMSGLQRKWREQHQLRPYIIRKIEPKNKRLREQELRELRNDKEMKNFFVLGSPENITSFLGERLIGFRVQFISLSDFQNPLTDNFSIEPSPGPSSARWIKSLLLT